MPDFPIIFFDCETNAHKAIVDLGAISTDGATFHSSRIADLQRFVWDHGGESALIAGHNICHFDIPVVLPMTDFGSRAQIDTLYLSALLFPQERFHALLKNERLRVGELSNPLSDAKKAKELFDLEVAAFRELMPEIQQILCDLLANTKPFGGFFQYLGLQVRETTDLSERIHDAFRDQVCEHADLQPWIETSPMELAFALALLASRLPVNVIPAWVQWQMPGVQRVLNGLCGTPCTQGCRYCLEQLNLHVGLKKWFGYDAFRTYAGEPLQENAATAALKGDALLAIFPTGGGKSLTFQLPALMTGENTRGLTVVISPLQSLMKDQVDHLKDKGIEVGEAINGLLDPVTRKDVLEGVESGRVRILYISPEQLRSKTIFRLLLGRHIERFVIDEAHCFSSWGHDFRVDYLYIAPFMKKLAQEQRRETPIPVSCFTATAKQKVIQDICDYFRQHLGLSLRLFTTNAARTNLHYQVIHVDNQDDKYPRLRELLESRQCPTIVYVSTVKLTVELSDRLNADGFKCCAFNGRMDPDEKVRVQDDFIQDRVRIMVATNAFGMGVDKSDVGLVVHYDIASSLENYVQEAGRAGRDERLEAECFVLFNEVDLDKHFQLHNRSKLTISDIQKVWQAVKRRTSGGQHQVVVSAYELANDSEADFQSVGLMDDALSPADKETRVRTALAVLEEAGYLRRGLNAPRIYATSLRVKSTIEAREKISHSNAFESEAEKDLAIRIVQSFVSASRTKGTRDEEASSRTDYLADFMGVSHAKVVDIVRRLREANIVADEIDIEARYLPNKKHHQTIEALYKAECFLSEWIANEAEANHGRFNLKDLHERLRERDLARSPTIVTQLLRLWMRENSATVKFLDRDNRRIQFKLMLDKIHEKAQQRLVLCGFLIDQFEAMSSHGGFDTKAGASIEVKFSIIGLIRDFAETLEATFRPTQRQMEWSLLYLKELKVLSIESGFLVNYPALRIERLVMDNRKRFTQADYRKLNDFYQQKIQQIHIVGEYANLMVKDTTAALQYVSDYFAMDYKAFIKKYFKGDREKELIVNMTKSLYERVYGALSPKQKAIIEDRSQFIAVCAGPGSGKTRVLVHKLASLLLEEDVKSEELLMLTFSRAAATEFAVRLRGLLGGAARFVEIRTFHSFSFDILGRRGAILESDKIVAEAAQKIRDGEVDPSRIAKTVLVLDEAQDMDENEFALVEALLAHNETLRVIAVGDDDQNIYAFRGSSSEYFRKLLTEYEATHHSLVDNYRSTPAVVDLSNVWAMRIPHRLKTECGRAIRKPEGTVKVISHRTSQVVGAVVDNLLRDRPKGRTAVLVKTNDEAGEVCGRLLHAGVRAKLIQKDSKVQPIRVRELYRVVDYFRRLILQKDTANVITDEQWDKMMRHFKQNCAHSGVYEQCVSLLKRFNDSVIGTRYFSDLETFLWEADLDDAIESDQNAILVSTIHKAKGTEFDNVYLVLGQGDLYDQAYLREVFVGITRAKTQLEIHHGPGAFMKAQPKAMPYIEWSTDDRVFPPADILQVSLGHSDLYLDYFIKKKYWVEKIESGQALKPQMPKLLFPQTNGSLVSVACFSRDAQEVLNRIMAKGYVLSEASVRVMVYWHKQDATEDTLILLPDLIFRRQPQGQ
ncbi:MAG: RecQ family ATP-dependent DNA helicase [Sutterella wadsworthensis]|nr:RecQ family ATP-dependent DNA helicase [Sutterella wadsworthensis]